MTTIHDLPTEMLSHIFKHTDLPTKKICRQVCESWRCTLDYHHHVYNVYLDESSYKTVLNCKNSIRSLTVGRLRSCLTISNTSSPTCCSSVTMLRFRRTISQYNLYKILSSSINIEYLAFGNYTLRNLKFNLEFWKHLTLNKLNHLHISLDRFDVGHHVAAEHLFSYGHFECVEKLHVEFMIPFNTTTNQTSGDAYPAKHYYQICPLIIQFVIRHKSSLTKLALILPSHLHGVHSSTQIKYISKCDEKLKQLLNHLQAVQLEHLHINLTDEGIGQPWSIGRYLMSTQNSLKNFVLMGRPLLQQDSTIIQRNAATLEILLWATTTETAAAAQVVEQQEPQQPAGTIYQFDCSILQDCVTLRALELITSSTILNHHLLPITLKKLSWSASLNHNQLQWMTRHLVNLHYLSLVCENYNEPGTMADILPITLDVFVDDILPMSSLTQFNLKSYCAMHDLIHYCSDLNGVDCKDTLGLTIYIDRKIFTPRQQ